MPVDKELTESKIHSKENILLKTITDIVAYKIYESPDDMGPESNFLAALNAVTNYVAEKFTRVSEFEKQLSQPGKGMGSINQLADAIYRYYQDKHHVTFDMIKDLISQAKDVNLKIITDIVAYKIYQSFDDKGPELNFVAAETFVSQYISDNFKNLREFKKCLTDLGKGSYALEAFADLVYKYYCYKKT